MRPLTPEETAVVDLLAEAWNAQGVLPTLHPMESEEFCRAIHAAQALILSRPAREALATAAPILDDMPDWGEFVASLSLRTRNALAAESPIQSFETLTALSKRDLLDRPRMGPMSFAEIASALQRIGLTLSTK